VLCVHDQPQAVVDVDSSSPLAAARASKGAVAIQRGAVQQQQQWQQQQQQHEVSATVVMKTGQAS
jgi:hypothetical protein